MRVILKCILLQGMTITYVIIARFIYTQQKCYWRKRTEVFGYLFLITHTMQQKYVYTETPRCSLTPIYFTFYRVHNY
jgi:hypothetical protein